MRGWFAQSLIALIAAVLAGCTAPDAQPRSAAAPIVARFFLETRAGEPAVTVQLPQSGVSIAVAPKPAFSEYDVANAELARVELGLCVLVQLTPAATRDLYRLSVPAQGRRLVISLNGVCLGVHRIDHAVADGVIPLFLEVRDEQLRDIVKQLKQAAATPAPLAAAAANRK